MLVAKFYQREHAENFGVEDQECGVVIAEETRNAVEYISVRFKGNDISFQQRSLFDVRIVDFYRLDQA